MSMPNGRNILLVEDDALISLAKKLSLEKKRSGKSAFSRTLSPIKITFKN